MADNFDPDKYLQDFNPDEYLANTKPVEPEQEPEEPGMPEAFARAMAQGVTFGFSDEITGKLKSMFKGTPYEQEVEKERQAYKAAEEAHPITSTVGEIAGGIVPAIATAPLTGGFSAAPLAARIGIGAAEGLATGAIYGAGKADKDTLEEAKSGAGMGALVGGAIPVVGAALKGVGKGISAAVDSENAPKYLKDLKKSLSLGLEDKGLVSSGSVAEMKKEMKDVAQKVPQLLNNELDSNTNLKQYLLENTNKTINIDDITNEAISSLVETPETFSLVRKIRDVVGKIKSNDYTGLGSQTSLKDASDLATYLNQYTKINSDKDSADAITKLVGELTDRYTKQMSKEEASQILKNAPKEIKQAFDKLSLKELADSANIDEAILQNPLKGVNDNISSLLDASKFLGGVHGNLTDVEKAASEEAIHKILEGIEKTSSTGDKLKRTSERVYDKLNKVNPNLANEIKGDMNRVSDRWGLHRAATGQTTIGEGAPAGKGLITGLASDLANVAGVGPMNLMGQTYSKLAKITKTPEKMLQKAASRFGEDSVIHKKLLEAASQPDENKRRAALNALMALEPFRKMLKEEQDAEETR